VDNFKITTTQPVGPKEVQVLKQWDRTFGGDGHELYLNVIQSTSDGGYLLGGHSWSGVTGNKSSGNLGVRDIWVVKIDANGNKLWDHTFGGTSVDYFAALQLSGDGGYLLGGSSASGPGGNKTSANFGDQDYWVVRIDANGNKLWENSFGGTAYDYLAGIQATSDSGYLLAGGSQSGVSGNKISPGDGNDYWLVKIDANGNKLWEKAFSFSVVSADYASAIQPTNDGGYLLGSYSQPGAFGGLDWWVVKIFEREVTLGTPVVLVNDQFSPSNSHTVVNQGTVTLQTTFSGGAIYYTLDGSTPGTNSTRYTAPFTVSQSVILKVIAFRSDNSQSALADPVTITIIPPLAELKL
jgi:hypothetical protein